MRKANGDAAGSELFRRVSGLDAGSGHARAPLEGLTESERSRCELLEQLSDAVLVHRSGKIVFANPAAVHLFGFDSPGQLIGIATAALIVLESPEQQSQSGFAPPNGADAGPLTGQGWRRDGIQFDCEGRDSQITWQGELATLTILREITERRREEREAAARAELIGTSLEIMGHGYCVFDANSRLAGFNRRFAKVYGVDAASVRVGLHHSDILRMIAKQGIFGEGDIEQQVASRVASALRGEERTAESNLPDGTTYLYQRRPMPNGGFVTTYTDITERKRAEKALHESEERYRGLIENAILPMQISTVDRSYVYVNQAYVDLVGYDSAEEVLEYRGKTIAPHDRERVYRMAEARNTDPSIPDVYEYDLLARDGTIIPVQIFLRRIVWDGKPAYQRTLIDLTKRKRAEEQLRQAQKMEAVGQLTGGVAHDFNNLLTIIQGNLNLIAERATTPEISRMSRTALKAVRSGAELTHRLLAFSRKQTLSPAVVRVDTLIADMSDLMRRTLGETIEMDISGGSDLWPCRVDPGQLESAILNLALNARDAMPEGGQLTITTANVVLKQPETTPHSFVPPGNFVMVSVADTGTGMTSDELEHAFEPFFTTKDVGAGSGLGLSMVHGFITQSGGYVTIHSDKGAGTLVKMFLPPSVQSAVSGRRPVPWGEPRSAGERILVVEDDADVRALVVDFLTGLGYQTLAAGTGEQAIAIMRETSEIDVLFTDVVLPGGISGVDVAKDAATLVPGIRILYTSGYADDVLARHGKSREGLRLIPKPYEVDDLARNIRAILDQAAAPRA